MNTARVLEFSELENQDVVEQVRAMAHKAVDQFVDDIAPKLQEKKKLTIHELSQIFQKYKQDFIGAMFQGFIEVLHHDVLSQEYAPCPNCGKTRKHLRIASRGTETRHGPSQIHRPYFYCLPCGMGYAPADHDLQLSASRKQHDLQDIALEFMAEMPFERASQLFSKATGISYSEGRMHDLLEDFGEQLTLEQVIPLGQDIEKRIDTLANGSKRRPVLMVATDGALVPIRKPGKRNEKRGENDYNEAKGFRIYLLKRDGINHLASWHQVTDVETFKEGLKSVAARIPRDKVRVGLIGDGASWLWKAMTEAFPNGREILDFYHCSQYIHALGPALYPNDSKKALEWVEGTMTRLSFKGGVSQVIGGLKRLKPRASNVKELIRKTITYLKNNKKRMDYRGARVGGYHIGSGAIESANKFICHTRLKRNGAWWLQTNCNKMLKLRCAIWNGTYESAFANYAANELAKRY